MGVTDMGCSSWIDNADSNSIGIDYANDGPGPDCSTLEAIISARDASLLAMIPPYPNKNNPFDILLNSIYAADVVAKMQGITDNPAKISGPNAVPSNATIGNQVYDHVKEFFGLDNAADMSAAQKQMYDLIKYSQPALGENEYYLGATSKGIQV
jgi:hypothetical protein